MLVVLDHVILGQWETVSQCYIMSITVLRWLREIQGSPNGEDCDTNHCCLKTISPAVGMFWDIASIWVLLKTKYTSIKQQQVSETPKNDDKEHDSEPPGTKSTKPVHELAPPCPILSMEGIRQSLQDPKDLLKHSYYPVLQCSSQRRGISHKYRNWVTGTLLVSLKPPGREQLQNDKWKDYMWHETSKWSHWR